MEGQCSGLTARCARVKPGLASKQHPRRGPAPLPPLAGISNPSTQFTFVSLGQRSWQLWRKEPRQTAPPRCEQDTVPHAPSPYAAPSGRTSLINIRLSCWCSSTWADTANPGNKRTNGRESPRAPSPGRERLKHGPVLRCGPKTNVPTPETGCWVRGGPWGGKWTQVKRRGRGTVR